MERWLERCPEQARPSQSGSRTRPARRARSSGAAPGGAPASAWPSDPARPSTSTSPGPTIRLAVEPGHSVVARRRLTTAASIRLAIEHAARSGWLVVRFDESMRLDPDRRRPPGAAHLRPAPSRSRLLCLISNAERNDPEAFFGSGRAQRARRVGRGGRNRGGRAVALLAAVLTWRGNGIEWIPGWRWHEKLMEVDHHV